MQYLILKYLALDIICSILDRGFNINLSYIVHVYVLQSTFSSGAKLVTDRVI